MSEYYKTKNSINSTNSKQQNLLFYMQDCKTCICFITTAQKINILKNFKMICIDGQKDKFMEQGLKKVPTIIIPSINKQFIGNECIKWLEDMIKLSSKNNNFNLQNEELYIPDIGIVSNTSNIQNLPKPPNFTNQPNLPKPPNNFTNQPNLPKPPNSMNHQISQLSSQISQLSTQINQSPKSNQFDIPTTNIIKRVGLNPVQPPSTINKLDKNIKIIGQNINSSNQLNSNQVNSNQVNTNNSCPTVKPINQLFGYLQNEMTGFSDGYAYINVDNPLPKSFLAPDKDMEIYTAPEGDKVNKNKQEQLMKLAEMERTNEHIQYKNYIDEINKKITMGEHNLLPKWIGINKDL